MIILKNDYNFFEVISYWGISFVCMKNRGIHKQGSCIVLLKIIRFCMLNGQDFQTWCRLSEMKHVFFLYDK